MEQRKSKNDLTKISQQWALVEHRKCKNELAKISQEKERCIVDVKTLQGFKSRLEGEVNQLEGQVDNLHLEIHNLEEIQRRYRQEIKQELHKNSDLRHDLLLLRAQEKLEIARRQTQEKQEIAKRRQPHHYDFVALNEA